MAKLPQQQQIRLEENAKAYKTFARSNVGKTILKDLRKRFYDVNLSGDDEHSSSVKIGMHAVVLHIIRMAQQGEKYE